MIEMRPRYMMKTINRNLLQNTRPIKKKITKYCKMRRLHEQKFLYHTRAYTHIQSRKVFRTSIVHTRNS